VFAWALIRPSIIAPFLIIAMGALLDSLWGAPLGLWEISLLIAYGVVSTGRSVLIGQSDGAILGWYLGACALMMTSGLLITLLLSEAAPSLWAVLGQMAATALLFPFAALLIQRFEDADVRFR
jgi:rod shape-determining protein MreD